MNSPSSKNNSLKLPPQPQQLHKTFPSSLREYPVRYIKGVGPKLGELFASKEIHSCEDLLSFFPFKYLDRRQLDKIISLEPGRDRVTAGKILSCGLSFAGRKRKIFEILLGDDTGAVSLKWFRFNVRQMMGTFRKGMGLLVSGEVTFFRGVPQFVHPILEIMDADVLEEVAAPGIVPVYSQLPGLGQKTLRKIIRNALDLYDQKGEDILPEPVKERHGLPDAKQSFREIHFPDEKTSLEDLLQRKTAAYKRQIFEEFFLMELGIGLKKKNVEKEKGVAIPVSSERISFWKAQLPYALTKAQERVLCEIFKDLSGSSPMNRLLQGDVGSGKTIVAFLSALAAIEAGRQVALMAPTEILAEQHFLAARRFFSTYQAPVAFLSGRVDSTERRRILARIRKKLVPIVIGTHALLSEGVDFSSLGLIIIDEQHRFGVLQRATLKEKGDHPHVLVMTATPIPRTLALTIYGDLDLSVIDELPPGRQPIRTEIIEGKKRNHLYHLIEETLRRGEQAYIVYPLVEESEKLDLRDATQMYEELQKIFPDFPIALLHGKMDSEQKEAAMREFKQGRVRLLVSTTVIEVGIDVPQATLMVVEHAERFGLSQLHQLRGRVGRGDRVSQCLLVTSLSKNHPGFDRLQVMVRTNDGFVVAEEDLKIRGPGDFLGTRQSGLPELKVANLLRDYPILELARHDAFEWLQKDPKLTLHPPLRETLLRRWEKKLNLAQIG